MWDSRPAVRALDSRGRLSHGLAIDGDLLSPRTIVESLRQTFSESAVTPMSPSPSDVQDGADAIAVRVEDVVKTYGVTGSQVTALRGVSFDIKRGERVALLGKSGSGKSTLLNLIGGLDRPDRGRISGGGRDIAAMTPTERAAYRLTTVGMIFQAYNLIQSRTALENVELPLVLAGRPRWERRREAVAALEAVGLGERLNHRPAQLSGGEHQRVAIARALVNRPEILLADEPTGNLDSATSAEIMAMLLRRLEQAGTTLIVVTHDEELARQAANRVVRLKDGLVVS
jgi:ABC-type lipoprotein export system ATPase subunit